MNRKSSFFSATDKRVCPKEKISVILSFLELIEQPSITRSSAMMAILSRVKVYVMQRKDFTTGSPQSLGNAIKLLDTS